MEVLPQGHALAQRFGLATHSGKQVLWRTGKLFGGSTNQYFGEMEQWCEQMTEGETIAVLVMRFVKRVMKWRWSIELDSRCSIVVHREASGDEGINPLKKSSTGSLRMEFHLQAVDSMVCVLEGGGMWIKSSFDFFKLTQQTKFITFCQWNVIVLHHIKNLRDRVFVLLFVQPLFQLVSCLLPSCCLKVSSFLEHNQFTVELFWYRTRLSRISRIFSG